MSKERKAELAPGIMAVLKEYGEKGTLSIQHYSTLVLLERERRRTNTRIFEKGKTSNDDRKPR